MALLWLGLGKPVLAAEGQHDASAPIHITASQLQVDDKAHQAVFKGDVKAKQDQVTLYGDKLTVFYKKNSQNRRIKRILVEGDVKIVQGARVATAQKATFFQQQEKVLLEEQAKVHQGTDEVAGERIELYLDEGRSEVKSPQKGRVNALIHPEEG